MDWAKLGNRKLTEEELWQKNLEVWGWEIANDVMGYNHLVGFYLELRNSNKPGNLQNSLKFRRFVSIARYDIRRQIILHHRSATRCLLDFLLRTA